MPVVERVDTVTVEALADEMVALFGSSGPVMREVRRAQVVEVLERHIGKRIEGVEQL